MRRLLLASLVLTLIGTGNISFAQSTSAAKNNLPEYFWQPAEFQNALIPSITYVRAKGDLGAGSDITTSDTVIGVRYERGFSDMFAMGFGLGYLAGTSDQKTGATTTTYTRSGLTDLGVSLKAFTPMSFGHLFYGTGASINLSKHTTNIGDKKDNASAGGYTISPYIGFDVPTSMGMTWGGRVSYALMGDRTVEVSNPTSNDLTISGGNTLDVEAFVEYPYGTITPGLAIGYANVAKTETKVNGTLSSESASVGTVAGRLYANIDLTPEMQLEPRLVFGRARVDETAAGGSNDINAFGGAVELRYLF